MQEDIHSNTPPKRTLKSILKNDDPASYKWRVLGTVIFGIFMVILDTTVVNVAFQTITEEFGGTLNDSQWIISIYVMSLGISTPLAGFLADRIGTKRIYLGGLGLFAIGSLLSGFAPSLFYLTVARAIQGVGGGLALPLGIALLLQAFPAKEQGTALGIFGIAALVAPAVGPILGGWLVDHNLWRVIFFINPPIGLLGIILGYFFLKEYISEKKQVFDTAGVITEVIGFGAILYAASIAADVGWGAPQTIIALVVGLIGLIAFGLIELFHAKSPLLDMRLFGDRIFLNASLLGYVSNIALFGAEFLMPLYLQSLRGETALRTGFILLPMAIAGGIFVTLSGRLYDKFGPRPLMTLGFIILSVNTWQLALLKADTPISWIVFLLVLRGIALGLTVQTTMVTALSVVPSRELPRGSSLINGTRRVAQSLGVAVLATVLASTLSPQIQAFQNQMETRNPGASQPVGICEAAQGLASTSGGPANGGAQLAFSGLLPSGISAEQLPGLLDQACQENISGFERAYKVTFYAALIALLLGVMLPGWPGKWAGRGESGAAPTA